MKVSLPQFKKITRLSQTSQTSSNIHLFSLLEMRKP